MLDPSPELAAMIIAARAAGAGLLRHFRDRSNLRVELKGPADFVSQADLESERLLRDTLLTQFPEAGFVAEEGSATQGAKAGTRFVVDPLDGTTNFLHGIPHFAVSIAYERESQPVAGVVFDPAKGELFAGEEGKGAWLGDVRLRVADDAELSSAVVGTGIPHVNRPERHAGYLSQLAEVMREAAGVRRFAAAALDLSYVAAGRLSAFFELGLARWDVAAGTLLVREAGGRVTQPDGGPDVLGTGNVLATNGRLHGRMQELLVRGAPRVR